MIDPSKDKFAYFKDNIQTAEDNEEFDASQYYYHRDDFSSVKSLNPSNNSLNASSGGLSFSSPFHSMASGGLGTVPLDTDTGDNNLIPLHNSYSSYSSNIMQGGPNSFLGVAGVGHLQIGATTIPITSEIHRTTSGRSFQLPTENKAPDMSEFPALGSRMGSISLDSSFEGSAADRMRAQPSEFVIQKEDFPALSTFGPSTSEKSPMRPPAELKRHSSFTSSAADGMLSSRLEQQKGGTSIGSRAGGVALPTVGAGISGSVNLGTEAFDHFRAPRQDEQTCEKTSNGKLDPSNQYGLLGMLHTIIRPGNDSRKNLAMGCDLTSLGLNLNSGEYVLSRPLHPTFASPWAEEQLTKEPQFSLPTCYYNQPPLLKTTHLSKFHLETLFFIFYSMPKDVLQAYAAQELYSREWRYHVELKTWLKRATSADTALVTNHTSSSASGTSTGASAGASGNGSIGSIGSAMGSGTGPSLANSSLAPQFLFFDTATWERRIFTGNINSISAGLLGEEEIRVKFNASS